MEENNNLTAERSLEIITEQIERSRRSITKNSVWSLIWWGSWIIVFSLLIAYLGQAWKDLWGLMLVICAVGQWFISRRKEPAPKSFIGKTIGQVWTTFGLFFGTIGVILGFGGCGVLPAELVLPDGHICLNITSIISLGFGIAATITGFVLENRIMQICGIIAGLGGFFTTIKYPQIDQLYVMAAVALVGLVIPGLIIKIKTGIKVD